MTRTTQMLSYLVVCNFHPVYTRKNNISIPSRGENKTCNRLLPILYASYPLFFSRIQLHVIELQKFPPPPPTTPGPRVLRLLFFVLIIVGRLSDNESIEKIHPVFLPPRPSVEYQITRRSHCVFVQLFRARHNVIIATVVFRAEWLTNYYVPKPIHIFLLSGEIIYINFVYSPTVAWVGRYAVSYFCYIMWLKKKIY